MWPYIENFLKNLPDASLVADAGTGNGKYFAANPRIFTTGSDMSDGLIGICRDRGNEVLLADTMKLPYRTNMFVCC